MALGLRCFGRHRHVDGAHHHAHVVGQTVCGSLAGGRVGRGEEHLVRETARQPLDECCHCRCSRLRCVSFCLACGALAHQPIVVGHYGKAGGHPVAAIAILVYHKLLIGTIECLRREAELPRVALAIDHSRRFSRYTVGKYLAQIVSPQAPVEVYIAHTQYGHHVGIGIGGGVDAAMLEGEAAFGVALAVYHCGRQVGREEAAVISRRRAHELVLQPEHRFGRARLESDFVRSHSHLVVAVHAAVEVDHQLQLTVVLRFSGDDAVAVGSPFLEVTLQIGSPFSVARVAVVGSLDGILAVLAEGLELCARACSQQGDRQGEHQRAHCCGHRLRS